MKQNILIIGASGVVGSEIGKQLKELGHNLRLATSKKSSKIQNTFHINLTTGEGAKEAFNGIDRAFFLSPSGYADQYKILFPLIEEAKNRSLKKVVLMSAMGADADPSSPLRRSELELEKSGVPYNIIRPNWFMQNFNTFWIHGILAQGKILLPAGNAKTSFIDARDISSVAVKLLTTDEKNNQAFNLTGPEAITHSQVASVLTETTGKKIVYSETTSEEFKSTLLTAGLPADYVDFLALIMGYLKAGYNSALTSSVKDILGREPISFQNYAKAFKSSFFK